MILDPERRTDPQNGLSHSGRSYKQLLLDVVKEYGECTNMFSDIEGHWSKKAIENMFNNKLMSGYSDGTFKPDQFMTRAEVASVIDNILKKMNWYKGE
jgi:uncharacterized protein YjgD (DUF1641 family)